MIRASVKELEQSIIGAVILKPDILALLPTLSTDHFENASARHVWNAIRNLEAQNKPIDTTTIADEVIRERASRMRQNEETQGEHDAFAAMAWGYLGECALTVPTTDNAIEYARRLKDHALIRRILLTTAELQDHARQGDMTGAEILSMAMAGFSMLDAEQPEQARAIGDVVKKRMKQLDEIQRQRLSGESTMTGFPTGVQRLDEKIGGWPPGIVSIIAARPGMGKSSLGLATADACSLKQIGCHVFSLEDTETAYADRSIARTSHVSAEDIRNCNINHGQLTEMREKLPALVKRPNWLFDDRSGITAEEIVRSVRRHRKDNNTKVVIVDYIQLVARANHQRRQSTHEFLSEVITAFADAAKQDSLAYVVMSQLNREIEKREDKRPQLSDLRESGSLEERSKCVVGVYRGAAYGSTPKKGVDYPKDQSAPSQFDFERTVQLLVLKNSNGRTGTVRAQWHGPTTRME